MQLICIMPLIYIYHPPVLKVVIGPPLQLHVLQSEESMEALDRLYSIDSSDRTLEIAERSLITILLFTIFMSLLTATSTTTDLAPRPTVMSL